ncbi:MAG: matrixin family metalloprotease [bacterium]
MHRSNLGLLSVLLAGLILAGSASALLVEMSPAEVSREASLIVSGTVTAVNSRWSDDRSTIYTDVTFTVDAQAKGPTEQSVTVRVPGGEVDDIGLAVEDQPRFSVGDRATLHLRPAEQGEVYELVGGYQGAVIDAKPVAYYSYTGYHRATPACDYYINSGLSQDWVGAITAGHAAWNGAGSRFAFSYLGGTTRTGPTLDGYNVINAGYLGTGGTIAQNAYWYNRRTKIVSENDITFNTYYAWTVGGTPTSFDIQNIATHELGHCLVLNDLYKDAQAEMTMYGYGAYNETRKRTLEQGDRDGIIRIYGAASDAGSRPLPKQHPSID